MESNFSKNVLVFKINTFELVPVISSIMVKKPNIGRQWFKIQS